MRNAGILGLLAVTAALILLTASMVYSEDNPRHTPGFPEYLPENLEDLLRYLKDVLSSSSSGLADLARLLETKDVESLASNIRNEFPRNLVLNANEAYASGVLTREDLHRYIQMLQEWYAINSPYGLNITEDFLLALRALSVLADKSGYHDVSNYADTLVYEVLRTLLQAEQGAFTGEPTLPSSGLSEAEGLVPPELSLPGSFELPLPHLPETGFKLPSFALPGMPFIPTRAPHVDMSLLVWIAVLSLVVLAPLVFMRMKPRLATLLVRALRPIKPLLSLSRGEPLEGRLPRPIALYWITVDFIAKRYGVRREPSTTHREFLGVASPVLRDQQKSHLTRLTRVYELVRYGGLYDPSLDEEAEKAYSELVKQG